MRFAESVYLYLFFGLPILIVLLIWAESNYKKKKQLFIANKLLNDVASNFDPSKRRLKNILIVLIFLFSIIALGRPQWGFELQEIERKGIDILVVVDTSKSMLTTDVKPNRLERTKLAVKDLVKKLKGDRIGLLAFSGDAFLVCPLTVDYNGFLLSLNDLNTGTIFRGGTNISVAIKKAMASYDKTPNKYKSIIIITDGDNLEGDPIQQAKIAKEKGIKIYTIGIGTKEGELIKVPSRGGQKEFLKDAEGNYVKSRLNEKLLREISLMTGGLYVKSVGAQFGLDVIYERELSKLQKREFESKMEKRYFERFQFPLSIAFILLLIESCLFTRKIRKKL